MTKAQKQQRLCLNVKITVYANNQNIAALRFRNAVLTAAVLATAAIDGSAWRQKTQCERLTGGGFGITMGCIGGEAGLLYTGRRYNQ